MMTGKGKARTMPQGGMKAGESSATPLLCKFLLSFYQARHNSVIFLVDPELRLLHMNALAENFFGCKVESLVGRNLLDIQQSFPWPMDRIVSALQASRISGEFRYDQLASLRGEMRYFENLALPLFDDTDGFLGYVHMSTDTTTRWRVEEELRKHRDHSDKLMVERTAELSETNKRLKQDIAQRQVAEEKYVRLATVVEQAAESILIVDTQGVVVYVNPAFEAASGYSRQEVLGRFVTSFRDNLENLNPNRDQAGAVAQGQVWTGHVVSSKKDGSLYEEEVSVFPIRDGAGKIINYAAIMRDVTQQVRLEKQLRQAQKLESIGQLAAGIAHEINTPIQYVGDNTRFLHSSFLSLVDLLDKYRTLVEYTKEPEKAQVIVADIRALVEEADLEFLMEEIPKAVEQSLDGISRVAEIVMAMKQFSHMGTEQGENIDLNKNILSTVTIARNEWKYVSRVETDLHPNLPAITCYPGELNQVILNLLVNAAHAIGEKRKDGSGEIGLIRVSTRPADEPGWVEIRISDTGTGIPEAIRDKIFDPFFTTKKPGKGTGQGLAIAHTVVVEKHGGSLHFETKMGEGTSFLIRLPVGGKKAAN